MVGMRKPTKSQLAAHLARAIKHAGSENKLAQAAGYTQHAVWSARQRGEVTAEMAVAIERATAGTVTKIDLRPDLFGS